jgi:hypothetical protein
MNDTDTAFSNQCTYVTIAELVGDVPAAGLGDEQAVEVAAFEVRWHVRGELRHAADY